MSGSYHIVLFGAETTRCFNWHDEPLDFLLPIPTSVFDYSPIIGYPDEPWMTRNVVANFVRGPIVEARCPHCQRHTFRKYLQSNR